MISNVEGVIQSLRAVYMRAKAFPLHRIAFDYSVARLCEKKHEVIVYLCRNNIDDVVQVEFLALCQHLTRLTFDGNPICIAPNPSVADPSYDYRRAVKKAVPQVQYLDDEPLVDSEQQQPQHASDFDEDWKLIDELVRDGMALPEDKLENMPGRPSTAWPQTATYRPGSALKPQSALRPPTAVGQSLQRRSTPDSSRPSSSSRSVSNLSSEDDVACELTTGTILCGSVSRALKNRKSDSKKTVTPKVSSMPEDTCDTALKYDSTFLSIVEELRVWKEQHRKRVQEIDASRAPQVLRIEHDDSIDVSDSDDDMSDDEIAACSEQFSCPEPLMQSDMLPGIESAGITHRPDTASEDAVLRKICSLHATADTSFDSTDSLDSAGMTTPDAAAGAVSSMRHSADCFSTPSTDPLHAPPDFLRPFSGPAVPPGSRTKIKLDPLTKKKEGKMIDPAQPVVRALTSSPERSRTLDSPRPGSSRASLGQIPANPLSMSTPVNRLTSSTVRRQLPAVPLLPSKFSK